MRRIALLLLALVIASLAHGTELSDDELEELQELELSDDELEEVRISANQGDVNAQSALTYGYTFGMFGVSEDPKKAFRWGRLAAGGTCGLPSPRL
jgi:TPR repeat protein